MEFRNPVYNRHGTIDCEVNHPRLGWIAFTASPDDPEESGRDIYAAAVEGEVGEYVEPESATPTSDDVNTERERRIAAGAVVTVTGTNGIAIQGRAEDILNLQGLGMGAFARISGGDTTTITAFRDANNNMHDLTPPQVFQLWQNGAAYTQAVYAASWVIKAMDPIPSDFRDNSYWPESGA